MITFSLKSIGWTAILALSFLQGLQAQNQITGAVKDGPGNPLPFATVLLLSANDSSLVRGEFSSAQGTYSFEDVPAGSFLIECSKLGFEQSCSKAFITTEQATHITIATSKNGVVESRLEMPNTETNHNQSFAGNINLTHQFSQNQTLNLDADMIRFEINNPSHYNLQNMDADGNPTTQSELQIDKKTPIRVAVAKADYTLGIGQNARLETGGKFTSMRFDNDVRVESRSPL